MSFDEEPDAPLHGECAAEIAQLSDDLAESRAECERLRAELALAISDRDAKSARMWELGKQCDELEQRATDAAGVAMEEAAKVCREREKEIRVEANAAKDQAEYASLTRKANGVANCIVIIRSLIANPERVAEIIKNDARYQWLQVDEHGISVNIADEDDPDTWYKYDSLALDAAIDAQREKGDNDE